MTVAADRDALILAHLAYARKLARKFARRYPGLADELESAALVGLTEAAGTFDPARGVKFRTHATARINGAMKDELRAWSPKGFGRGELIEKFGPAPGIMHLSSVTRTDDSGRESDLSDLIPDAESGPVGWEIEYHDEVAALARRLAGGPGAEAFRFLHTRADCTRMKDAGRAVGISESRMSQVCTFAEAMLRERFPDPLEVFMGGAPLGTHVNRLNGSSNDRFLEPIELHPDPDAGESDGVEPVPDLIPEADPEPADSLIRRYAAAHPGLGPGELSRTIEAETGRKFHSTKVRCVTGTFRPGQYDGGRGPNRKGKAVPASVAALDFSGPDSAPANETGASAAVAAAPGSVAFPAVSIPASAPSGSARAEVEAMLRVVEVLESLDVPTGRRVVGWLAGRYLEGQS